MKTIYAKGGRVIAEAERLFPFTGTCPEGGPDAFLLGVLSHVKKQPFNLVSFGPESRHEIIDGRDVVEYGVRPESVSYVARRMAYLRESFRFVFHVFKWQPTHLLCGIDGPFAVFAYFSAKMCRARFIFLVHNALNISSTSFAYKLAHRYITKRSDMIIVHGPFLRDQVLSLGAFKSRVFEFDTGLDERQKKIIDAYKPRSKKPSGQSTIKLVCAGRIEEEKGVFDLLDAFSSIDDKRLRLVFVGTGSRLAELRNRVAQCQFKDRIEVLGAVAHDEIFLLMREADAVVTPTQSIFPEGRCMTVMEAFYVGTPVIAPDFGPFPYLVKHRENGLLYPADDVDCLKKAVLEIANSRELSTLRDGAARSGRQLMKPEVNFEQVIGDVLSA